MSRAVHRHRSFRSKLHRALRLSVPIFLSAGSLHAATHSVPGSYPTIQAGIDAAEPGDTVLVAPRIYRGSGNKNLNFNGKSYGQELCLTS